MIVSFITTFSVFPGVMDSSYYPFLNSFGSSELSWYFLINSTIFNIGDTIGRKVGGHPFFMLQNKTIIILTAFRCIFIATLFLVVF